MIDIKIKTTSYNESVVSCGEYTIFIRDGNLTLKRSDTAILLPARQDMAEFIEALTLANQINQGKIIISNER